MQLLHSLAKICSSAHCTCSLQIRRHCLLVSIERRRPVAVGFDELQWTAPEGASGDAFGGGIDVWNHMFSVTSSRASDLQVPLIYLYRNRQRPTSFLPSPPLFLALAHRDRRTVALAQK